VELGLRDRVAVVTGASRGIGRRVALDLAAEGCRLVVTARTPGLLEEVAGAARDRGAGVEVVTADLRDATAAGVIVAAATDAFGRVDILVNNAGVATPKRLLALSDDDWHQEFELDFFAAVRLVTACVPIMRQRSWGRVINVASTHGREPDPLFGPYSASKAALINFTKSCSHAFSAEGVLSNCVIPGVTLTELVEENAGQAATAAGITPEEVMQRMLAKNPVAMGRFGQVEEIAAAVVFLASERSSWITGASLTVDGGTLRGTG
jgi:3-oxoacyl-[acyl-carrier protein] reductase